MSEEHRTAPWWLPMTLMVVLTFAIGLGGGSLLGWGFGGLFGTPEETAPLEAPGNLERRTDLIAGVAPKASAQTKSPPETAQSGRLLETPAQEDAPPPSEDSRSLERRLLALDSPLTPPATDVTERIRRGRAERQAAQLPAQDNTGPENAAAPGAILEAGTSSLSRQAQIRQTGAMQTGDGATPRLYVLARGAVIPAVLQSAIDSELPGLVRAVVAEDVYDSLSGTHILIPRGARLIGTYGQAGSSGQRRLFVAWTDLRMPGYISGGTPIDLEQFSTLGADGASGLKGRRSTGFWQALGAAVLFDLAGNATAILTNQQAQPQSDIAALAGAALGNATSRVTSDYIGTLLNRGPRFRVKAGSFMNVLVEQDLSLPAIRSGKAHRP